MIGGYRDMGRTGQQASIIGLSCEHLDGKSYMQTEEIIHATLDCGINLLEWRERSAGKYRRKRLSRPAVSSVLLGCRNGEEVKNALSYFDASDADKDYTPFLND